MSIYLDIVSHDDIFQQLGYPPQLANDFDVTIKEEKDRLNNLLYTQYNGDSLLSVPHCGCGHYSAAKHVNKVCPKCGEVCTTSAEVPIQSGLWMRVPKNVAGFINPHVWIMLQQNLKVGPVNYLNWLVDPSYKVHTPTKELNKLMNNYPIERGITSLLIISIT